MEIQRSIRTVVCVLLGLFIAGAVPASAKMVNLSLDIEGSAARVVASNIGDIPIQRVIVIAISTDGVQFDPVQVHLGDIAPGQTATSTEWLSVTYNIPADNPNKVPVADWEISYTAGGQNVIEYSSLSGAALYEAPDPVPPRMAKATVGPTPKLDLIFCIDTTGSMGDDIAAVKSAASEIINRVASKWDYRIAVVDYRDFPVSPYGGSGDYAYHDDIGFTTSASAANAAIQSLSLGWGADWQESVLSAVMHCVSAASLGGWRGFPPVLKAIILMRDAPAHDPEPFTGYTVAGVIRAALRADPVVLFPVDTGTSTPMSESLEFAEGTGGEAFAAYYVADIVPAIEAAIDEIAISPVAEADGPYKALGVGTPITFDGSGSYVQDSTATIVQYEWDVDDDGTYDLTTPSPTIAYTYPGAYSGSAILRVTDSNGNVGLDIADVAIRTPFADAGGPYQEIEGNPVTFDGSGSFAADPGGSIVQYEWDFESDGTYDASETSPTVVYTYPGTFSGNVTLRVTDNNALTATGTGVVAIIPAGVAPPPSNTPPVADAGLDQTKEATSSAGAQFALDGTGSYDPDGDPITYEWTAPGIAFDDPTSATPTATFPLGTTTVTLIVNDGMDDSAPDYVDITVVDTTPPTISVVLTPDWIWPPDHMIHDITAGITVTDIADPSPTVTLVSVVSNQPDQVIGHPLDSSNDIQGASVGTDDRAFSVRAEHIQAGGRSRSYRRGRARTWSEVAYPWFTDRTYTATYRATDGSGNTSTATAVVTVHLGPVAKVVPTESALYGNIPNPFNPVTEIAYALAENVPVRLVVYNLLGQPVATLVDEPQTAGYHTAAWNASGMATGVYIYCLEAGSFTATKKMILVR